MTAKIRRLQGSDRNDIIEISRHVWEGHDYLPSVADQWLQDPNSHFYGVEVQGHIVAGERSEVEAALEEAAPRHRIREDIIYEPYRLRIGDPR